jgi:hypothetical protein
MKINSQTLNLKQQQFEQDLDYEEWLRENNPPPTNNELNNMNKVFCKSKILKNISLDPINTLNYQPLQGA